MNFRTIAKFCFLLVVIGFFMPMACDGNGFQIAGSEFVDTSFSLLLYGLFISALAGLLIGVLLLMKKNVPIIIDWLIILVCMCCGLIPFFGMIKEYGKSYQTGVYVIITGFAVILIAQIISSFMESSKIENKSHHSLDIKSHLLDITSLTFIISMLLCIFVDNNTLKIVVFSVLLMLIIIAGTYERLKEEK